MKKSICGVDCDKCEMVDECNGCDASSGKPFGKDCMIAECCHKRGKNSCAEVSADACVDCSLKKQLIDEFNALKIEDMEEVTDLNALRGAFVNLEYALPSGQRIKIWDDDKIYLGNQLGKKNSDRCYGITADVNYLMVCEYGENGADAEIILFKKRKQ